MAALNNEDGQETRSSTNRRRASQQLSSTDEGRGQIIDVESQSSGLQYPDDVAIEEEEEPLLHEQSKTRRVWSKNSLSRGTGEKGVGRIDGNPLEWFMGLADEFGWKFLILVIIGAHLNKGFLIIWLRQTMKYWYRDHGGVPAPSMQVFIAIGRTPWCLKGLIGLISDSVSLFGYRRNGYMLITAIMGMGAGVYIVSRAAPNIEVEVAIGSFLLMELAVATTDLLVEARYSEQVKLKPSLGSDIVSFVTGGQAVGGILAAATVGSFLQATTVNWAFLMVVLSNALVLIPVTWRANDLMPFLTLGGRQCMSVPTTTRPRSNTNYVVLVSMLALLSVSLLVLGLVSTSVYFNAAMAYGVGLLGILLFYIFTLRRIAEVNCYFLFLSMCHLGGDTAYFYFFTDTKQQYPRGPHFSRVFYTTSMSLVPQVFILFSVTAYNKYLRDYSWRTIFFLPTVIAALLSMINIIVFKRWNIDAGISDMYFIVGSEAIQEFVHGLNYVPMALITSHLCPDGLEATMFALLAGSRNMGRVIGDFGGAALLKALDVGPDGSSGEEREFDRMWIVCIVVGLAQFLPLFLIPFLIPEGRPSDRTKMASHADEKDVANAHQHSHNDDSDNATSPRIGRADGNKGSDTKQSQSDSRATMVGGRNSSDSD